MKLDDQLQGWEVWVDTEDGERLNEYTHNSIPKHNQITCWLETPSDLTKHFRVYVRRPPQAIHQGIRFCLDCDGRQSGTKPFRPGLKLEQRLDTMITEDEGGRIWEVKLRFGRMETTDDEDVAVKDAGVLKALGEIRVRLERGEWIHTGRGNRTAGRRTVKENIGPVHERVKKGTMDMTIGLASGKFGQHAGSMFRKYGEGDDFTVIFKYASRGLLLARDIIPRPETPEDEDDKDALIGIVPKSLPGEEEDQSDGAFEEVDASALRLKREPETPIKSGHRKKPIFVPDEYIDLCSP